MKFLYIIKIEPGVKRSYEFYVCYRIYEGKFETNQGYNKYAC